MIFLNYYVNGWNTAAVENGEDVYGPFDTDLF